MYGVKRYENNPFLLPGTDQDWDACAAFNPSVIKHNNNYHCYYRAQSRTQIIDGEKLSIASLGYAIGKDGLHFNQRTQVIKPDRPWDKFGCEDPRATLLENKTYVFYTALSLFPFEAKGIRVGLAILDEKNKLIEKHPVTPFNAKAMALFPEKINGQFAAVLTVNSDLPPSKIAIALFDEESQIWSEKYWDNWYATLDMHVIPLLRSAGDHLEVGATPLKTEQGWLMIYCYINDYFTTERSFAIEAVLLDLKDPKKVIGRTSEAIFIPEKEYELVGDINNVIFPSSALIKDDTLTIYYGAADTTCCAAHLSLSELLEKITYQKNTCFIKSDSIKQGFKRYTGNPIIQPRPEFFWEAKATFNPAAIYLDGKFHIIYRAMSFDNTSVLGYAMSLDGYTIEHRSATPIYSPSEIFEQKLKPGNSGCEDPRLSKIGELIYLFYTAFDGYTPRVAYSTISVADFLHQRWNWRKATVISPPEIDDKDACILSKKVAGNYVIFHRLNGCICINSVDSLEFGEGNWLTNKDGIISPRKTYWDNRKFGIAAPPIETSLGWLLFFHRISIPGDIYKIEALLLKIDDPKIVIAESDATLFEPEMDYEKYGLVNNVVFPCGAVLHNDEVFLYYGGSDKVVGVAKMKLSDIFKRLGL